MTRTLIAGMAGDEGPFLARLLMALGQSVAAVVDAGTPRDGFAALGIADDLETLDWPAAVTAIAGGRFDHVHVLPGAPDARLDAIVDAFAAAPSATRLCIAVNLPAAAAALARGRRAATLRDAGRFACTAWLDRHDSRLGTRGSLAAMLTMAAWRAAQGQPTALPPIVDEGPLDWGWTAEYVDALRRMLAGDTATDRRIATGHSMDAATFARHAFACFGLDAGGHVELVAAPPRPLAPDDPGLLPPVPPPGWKAATYGRDLVKTLCDAAADRASRSPV